MFANREVETDARCDWTKPCGNETVLSAVHLNNWYFVYPAQKEKIVENFAFMANEAGKRIGIKLATPHTVALRDDKPDTYYNEIKKIITRDVSQLFQIIFYYFKITVHP
jgi:hypothetical protein